MSYEQRARDYLDRFPEEPTWDVYSPDAQAALEALCESIASDARAKMKAEASREAERYACDPLWYAERRVAHRIAESISLLASDESLVVVAREDLATVIEAADRQATWTAHEYGTTAPKVVALRAAIDRLRAGEE